MRTSKIIMLTGMLLAATACKYEGSTVQKQYSADREECRAYAEHTARRMNGQGQGAPGQAGNLALVSRFADCMHERGWAVNRPKKPDEDDG